MFTGSLQPDEAQRGHYNDGYNPYTTQYEHQPYNPNDPFSTPQTQSNPYTSTAPTHPNPYTSPPPVNYSSPPPTNPYSSPPPTHDAYGVPLNPHSPPPNRASEYGASQFYGAPINPHSPPPNQNYGGSEYMSPPQSNDQRGSPGIFGPRAAQPRYALTDGPIIHDDNYNEPQDDDMGDIPLLRRDNSAGSNMLMPVPGSYEQADANDDAMSENNIRYGEIPRRVPRRYKTIKKVE